jgi:hypothetical protein
MLPLGSESKQSKKQAAPCYENLKFKINNYLFDSSHIGLYICDLGTAWRLTYPFQEHVSLIHAVHIMEYGCATRMWAQVTFDF